MQNDVPRCVTPTSGATARTLLEAPSRGIPVRHFGSAAGGQSGQSGPMTQNSLPAGSWSTRVVHSPASVRETDDAPAANISST